MASTDPLPSTLPPSSVPSATQETMERNVSQPDPSRSAETSLKGAPTVVEPEMSKQKPRTRRRVVCYACTCFCFLVIVLVAAVLIFVFAILKKPNMAFQAMQPSTDSATMLRALATDPSHLSTQMDLVYQVTNPNAFALDLYGIDLGAYADPSKQLRLVNGTLPQVRLDPGKQLVTVPITLTLPLPPPSAFSSAFLQACFPSTPNAATPLSLYYEVKIGITWIHWLTDYKYPVTGQFTVPCPFNFSNVLQAQQLGPWLTPLLSAFPNLANLINPSSLQALLSSPSLRNLF